MLVSFGHIEYRAASGHVEPPNGRSVKTNGTKAGAGLEGTPHLLVTIAGKKIWLGSSKV